MCRKDQLYKSLYYCLNRIENQVSMIPMFPFRAIRNFFLYVNCGTNFS